MARCTPISVLARATLLRSRRSVSNEVALLELTDHAAAASYEYAVSHTHAHVAAVRADHAGKEKVAADA